MTSTFKTAFLLALLTLAFIYLGNLFGGRAGMTIALGIALVMNAGAYWYSDKLVLKMYKADETAARLTGEPLALATALKKISLGNERAPMRAEPATAHMFIMNPLKGGLAGLFSTHPPLEERIARLESMAYGSLG